MPQNLDLSGVKPEKKMSEEEYGKAYVESMIMLPAMIQTMTEQIVEMGNIIASLSILSLYFEKKGLKEGLFTEKDLEEVNE